MKTQLEKDITLVALAAMKKGMRKAAKIVTRTDTKSILQQNAVFLIHDKILSAADQLTEKDLQ